MRKVWMPGAAEEIRTRAGLRKGGGKNDGRKEKDTNLLPEFCQLLQEPVSVLWMHPGVAMLELSRRRAGGGGMAGRSLGWGVQDVGRRMSVEIRIGGRVGEMPFLFRFVKYVDFFAVSWILGWWGGSKRSGLGYIFVCMYSTILRVDRRIV